ncbi:N-acetylhexosaminidase [Cristinia sonorae]|uniref:Beta-hexosaminidase n=1 Tax=Cristinia sonorae TaxID=1940300 RepID=A0A8K0UGW3_9AGAR|nr:N-acetylhexosaminidase [Cristinia sonorae]
MRLVTLPVVFTALLATPTTVLALWPIPKTLQTGSTPLKLSSNFKININIPHAPSDLHAAVQRTITHLKTDNLQRLVKDRGAADLKAIHQHTTHTLSSLTLSLSGSHTSAAAAVTSIAEEAVKPIGTRSEGYTVHVPADGSPATITANSTLGLFRGLTTFEQLWYTSAGGQVYTLESPVEITDFPSVPDGVDLGKPYRGLMLDTSRNFFPVKDIKRTLDAMSMAKINTLHWHATDSQSFPLQIPGFTEISAMGAYGPDMVFTPSDIKDIVSYAGERGIDVVVEIDTPGHTAIISESHPEHIACLQAVPWSDFANEPPAGQLRLASPATANFTADLLSAAAKLFASSLFSTGGDELNSNCYVHDAETQKMLNATGRTLEQALDAFTQTTHGALRKLGKTPVVWEEMVLDHNVTLSNDTVVMVWISSMNAAAVAKKNFRIVHAPSDFFYLDCGAGEWIGADPTGNSWCDPFKTWQKSYTFDPLANISAANAHLVLGGEQLLWAEQSSPANLDSIVWPRAASSAEVFWTGATLPDGSPRAINGAAGALPRLHDLRYRMVQRGINAIPLQPHWCAVRPGVCDLTA